MPMSIRQFEPSRAVEIIAPKYGSGYRIGGRLVLTAAHLLGDKGSDCEVRDKPGFGKENAQVVWKAQGLDIALIELPEKIAGVEAITIGKLPKVTAGEKLAFQMYGYPLWARTQREQGSAAGGRQIEGIIYLSDRSPDGLLVLEAERLPPEATNAESEWLGASGAAIVCDGLVIAVQSQHQNPNRPASLEASPLWTVYEDEQWRQLLEKHGINPEPEVAHLPTADKPLDIPWHEVSAQRLEKRRQLTTNSMTRRGDVVYEVDQVFVPLGLIERKKVPRSREDVSPEQGSELYQEGMDQDGRESDSRQEEITQKFEHQQFLEQVLQQGQSPKSQGKRIAIIGEPGAGKTTLLQQMGRWVLDTFPTSIVIWVSLAALQGDTLESYLEHRWLQGVIRTLGGAQASQADKHNFADQFRQGRVWLLLDGLDEMQVAGNPLSDIQRQIQEGGWLQQARILLTCRVNLWGSSRNALDTFDTYRTLEFVKPGQVERFIEKWFAPQGENAIQQGQALCEALQEPGKERIRDLVKNPLRLTLLCFDWYSSEDGLLPETQAELYQRFVERIYEWKAEEFPTTAEERQRLNRDLARLSLAAIDDQDERGNARFRLRHQFVTQHLSEDSLDLALELGWLNDIGVDVDDLSETVYAFYHTTFEEYFAALAIEDWDFFLPREHRNRPVKDKNYRIFEPQWKQVFLLWLGREGGELARVLDLKPQKEALIQALMTFEDGCRGFYSDRAFLLAAAGLAEFKDCPCADKIIDRLMRWVLGSSNWLQRLWAELFDSVRVQARSNRATNAFGSTDLQRTIRTLVRVLDSTPDEDTRWRAAESLGQIGTGNKTAIRALVRVLDSTPDEDTRWRAAESLGQIDPGNETAIKEMVRVLKSTPDEDTRRRAAESLGQIDPGNETAIKELVRVLKSTPYSVTRVRAAESLEQIGTGNETAIKELVRVLESEKDEDTHWSAASSLGRIGTGNETAIRALVRMLESTPDAINRERAAESLGQIGTGNETAIRALVRMFESAQDVYTRRRAAESLGQIDPGNETAIRALVRMLESAKDESARWSVAWNAARSLSRIGAGNETAIKELVRVLESTPDVYTRVRAAESLGRIGAGNETAIRALVRVLESTPDEYEYTYGMAAESLGRIGTGNETAIRALVWVFESTQDKYTHRRAASSLGQIGTENETAIRALVRVLESTQDKYTRRKAVESLGQIGMGNETAIRALVRVLESTQDEDTRWSAAESLGQIDPGNEMAIRDLVRVLRHPFRSGKAYQLMVNYAEALPYPVFYQAFHASR